MTPTRRTFLQATVGAAALGASARPAFASSAHVLEHVQDLRRRGEALAADCLARAQASPLGKLPAPFAEHLPTVVHGFAAFSTAKELEALPVDVQVHPGVQALLTEVAEAVGAAALACRDLLAAFLSTGTAEEESTLRATLTQLRGALGSWPIAPGRRNQMTSALLQLEREKRPGALRRRIEHLHSRVEKIARLTDELAERRETGAYPIRDPGVLASVQDGRERWMAEAIVTPTEAGASDTAPRGKAAAARVAGILLLSLGVVVSGVFLLVTICMVGCGDPLGVPLFLLALALLVACIAGGIALLRKARTLSSPPTTAPELPTAAKERLDRRDLYVDAGAGWVATGIERAEGRAVVVRASGLVRSERSGLASADGSARAATADALLPQAPVGALVGRVGDATFLLGSEARVPDGPDGELLLAVNGVGAAEPARGYLLAEVTVYGSVPA